ncbi:MAG TPA: MaoC family dehydratase N-terminal domain-containing protein [Ktedonobacteraceae bacterium]|nr:MaoC family dehydratase N-terminal domain-containing protein [Ktedonobacteraceae bacterium]
MFDITKIGYCFPPYPVTIERTKLRELALAIGDPDVVYQDRQAAHAAGYEDVPLPPTTATILLFWENRHFLEQLVELGLDISRLIHREETYEYLAPLHPGETLMGVMTVLDGATRKGPRGSAIDLITLQLRYTNREGQLALIATTRLVTQ